MTTQRRPGEQLLALLLAVLMFSFVLTTITTSTASAQEAGEVVYEYSYDHNKDYDLGIAGDYVYDYSYDYALVSDGNGGLQVVLDYDYDLAVGDLEKSYEYDLNKGNNLDAGNECGAAANGINKGYQLDLSKGYELNKGNLEKGYDYDLNKGYDYAKGGPDCLAALCAAGAGGIVNGLFDGVSKGYNLDVSKDYELAKGDLEKGYDYDLNKGYDFAKGEYADVDIAELLDTCEIDICTAENGLGILVDLFDGPVEGVNKGYELDKSKSYDLAKGDLEKGYDYDLNKGYDFAKGDLAGLDAELLSILSTCTGLINPCDTASYLGSDRPTCEVAICAVDGTYAVSGGLFGDLIAGLFDGVFSGVSKSYDLDKSKGYELAKGDLEKGYEYDLNKGYDVANGDYANLDLGRLLGVFDLSVVDFNVDNCAVDVCAADGSFAVAGGLLGGLVDGVSKGYDLEKNKGYELNKGDLDKAYEYDLSKGYDFAKGDVVNVSGIVDLFDLGQANYSIDDCAVDVCAADGAFVVDGGLLGGLLDGVNKGYDLDLDKGYELNKGDLNKAYDYDLEKGYDFAKGEVALGGLLGIFDFSEVDFDLGDCSIEACITDAPFQEHIGIVGGIFDGVAKGYDLEIDKGYDLAKGDLEKGYDFGLNKGYDFAKGEFVWGFSCSVTGVDFADAQAAADAVAAPAAADAQAAAQVAANRNVMTGAMVGDIGISVSCLGGNGRVDTNIVNHGDDQATYVVEFANLRPRQRIVKAGDWGRISISGRQDDVHPVVVTRNGETVLDTTVAVACDGADAQVSDAEVSVINACRSGYGYILFQMVNPLDDARPYVIEFDNVPNRSTIAQGHGAAVRAVTGRQNGIHGYLVRSGSTIVDEGTVTVDC